MRNALFVVLTGLALVLAGGSAGATTITSTVGDLDCFGLGGTCEDGDLWRDELGGVFFTDYRDAGDLLTAPHTDIWDSPGDVSWDHTYVLGGTPIAASFEFRIAGFADVALASLFIDGVLAATYDFSNPFLFQTVHFLTVLVPLSAIDGSTSFMLTTSNGDGWIMDSSTLTIETADVPEPGTMLLLGAGLIGISVLRRRIH